MGTCDTPRKFMRVFSPITEHTMKIHASFQSHASLTVQRSNIGRNVKEEDQPWQSATVGVVADAAGAHLIRPRAQPTQQKSVPAQKEARVQAPR